MEIFYKPERFGIERVDVHYPFGAMRSRKENAVHLEYPSSGSQGVVQPPRGAPLRKQPELVSLAKRLANRQWADDALVESEARYRVLTEIAVDAIVTIDEVGEILVINAAAERIFGYPASSMLGRSLKLLLPGYSTDVPHDYRQREMAGRHKDGHFIPLEVSLGQFTQGSQTLATGILRDISSSKSAEDASRSTEGALRRANESLHGLIEQTPLAIVAFDFSENITAWNSAAGRMFGWSETEMLGQPLPQDPGKRKEQLRFFEALHQGKRVTVETSLQRKDGVTIDVGISAAPLAGPDGSTAGVVAAITDISERKRLEVQLREAQKMETVGRLASGIAHDFNTLLTVISGYDEMLLNSLPPDSRPRAYALEILHSTEKASALTKQLLAFIRRQVAHPAPLDINPLIANLGNMLRRLIGEDIEIVILPSKDMGTVRVNPSQIEQIVINLAVNARDAMPGGGRITIQTGVVDLGEDRAEAHFDVQPGRYVSIAVTDTGHGMTQKTRSRIFEPFFTTKEQGHGTGLGLATIYGIVKQNHGDIWVYSEPGKGSTFKIYLPAVDELAETLPSAGNRILQRGMETILVAEDDAGLRLMTQELLERLGYTVLIAECSQEAIRIASVHPGPIHLLLTDVVMPKANGRELAEKLGYLRRQTRVLYMSGYPSETVVGQGALGADVNFLEKPFTLESLARKVRAVLDA